MAMPASALMVPDFSMIASIVEEAEALVVFNRARPVIVWLFPVTNPPSVKSLIWSVPVELESISALRTDASRVAETEAFDTWSCDTDAVLISRVLVNWLEAAVKVQAPVIVWLAEREAGPLA